MICVFVENQGNPMLLSLQIIAMLTWKERPYVENLQIVHYVNRLNTVIPGYYWQPNVFCCCYRNMGHFRCSVERIKDFLNLHLHCIVNNVPYKVRKYSGPPELLLNEISFLRTCNIPKQWKLHRKQGAIWMKCVFCSYFDKIVYLIRNSQSL